MELVAEASHSDHLYNATRQLVALVFLEHKIQVAVWRAISTRFQKKKKREQRAPSFQTTLKTFTEYPNATHFVMYHKCFFRANTCRNSATFVVSKDCGGEITFLEYLAGVAYLLNSLVFLLER